MSTQAQTTTHVQLILDASGSMLGRLPDGQTRIDWAKNTLTQFLTGLKADPSLNVGMRIYGGGLKAGAQCKDSVLVTPMKGFDKAALQTQVNDAKPKGATPIVYSLMQAANDFPRDSSRKVIVLVTDGEESCGGKLTDAVAAFKKLGIEVDLRIIGIDLNENTRSGQEVGEALNRATATAQTGKYAVSGPESAGPGSVIEVKWTGPNTPGDYVTVVPGSAPVGQSKGHFYTKAGNSGKLTVPLDPGEYEIRYSSEKANPNPTLASQPITLTLPTYGLSAMKTAGAGSVIEAKWIGPNNSSDYVTIDPKGAPAGQYTTYFYTTEGNPGKLIVPLTPGEYELRYSSEKASPNPTLASAPITLTPATYGLFAPASARSGSSIQVKWTSPNNPGDYLTVVRKGAPVGEYTDYFYTKDGNPGTLTMPKEAGSYELRYSSEKASPNPILFSINIEVKYEAAG